MAALLNTAGPVRMKISRRQVWFQFMETDGGDPLFAWADTPHGRVEFWTDGFGFLVTKNHDGSHYTHNHPCIENFDVMDAIAGIDTVEARAEQQAKIQSSVEAHPLFGSF